MKQWMIRILLLVMVIGLMTVIFAFSAQPGPESALLTEQTVLPLMDLLTGVSGGQDAQVGTDAYHVLATIIRKTAHMMEYALLGILLKMLLESFDVRKDWAAVVAGVLYAASDELHQCFVPGRAGRIADVLIDAVGILLGLMILRFIVKRWRLKHVHDQ